MTTATSNFHWKCKHTWKRTKWKEYISFLSKYNVKKVDFNEQSEIVKIILKEVINTIQKELNIVDLLDEHISNKNIMEIIDFILSIIFYILNVIIINIVSLSKTP